VGDLSGIAEFDFVYLVDFEYGVGESQHEAPEPRCMVARDFLSGQTRRVWLDGAANPKCPITLDERSLYVAFYAPAETSCHVSLGWPMPQRVLDLYAELRWFLNGKQHLLEQPLKGKQVGRHSLLAALYYFGLGQHALDGAEKEEMRQLALRGGPYSTEERYALTSYCETDVLALQHLLPAMLPTIELDHALLRGRFMAAAGAVQHNGVPVDLELFERLKANWPAVIDQMIENGRDRFDVIKHRDIDQEKLARWLFRNGIKSWPASETGAFKTDSDTLAAMARVRPEIMQLKEFLHAVRKTRLFRDLSVGSDGRNRFMLSPFASKTGRNQPSSSRSIFGPATWVRSLIQAPPGQALLYCDWSGQELGLAAYFSGDEKMIADYESGDPYLNFGKRIGLVPQDATKVSHPVIRDQLKVALGLGVLYGAQANTVARSGNMTPSEAKRALQLHRATYPVFWDWRQAVIDHATTHCELRTEFGWRWCLSGGDNCRSASNFPMQANGAEMMRIAVCLAVERGVKVCCPVHDALLVEGPADGVQELRQITLDCMREASQAVIGNAALRVGVEGPVCHPDHYTDPRGRATFEQIVTLLESVESSNTPGPETPTRVPTSDTRGPPVQFL